MESLSCPEVAGEPLGGADVPLARVPALLHTFPSWLKLSPLPWVAMAGVLWVWSGDGSDPCQEFCGVLVT